MRQIVGAIFCGIAAVLYSANYVAAASILPNIANFSTPPGRLATTYSLVGETPKHLAYVALVVGIAYLVLGELSDKKSKEIA